MTASEIHELGLRELEGHAGQQEPASVAPAEPGSDTAAQPQDLLPESDAVSGDDVSGRIDTLFSDQPAEAAS